MRIPPLLVCFDSAEDYLRSLAEDTHREYGQLLAPLMARNLPPVLSKRCLAVLFGYSPKFVGHMYDRGEKYYREFVIPKGRGHRIIQSPKSALKVIQRWLGHYLAAAVTHADCVHGFVTGRSNISAAAVHCGAEWIYSIDIQDFFPSITVRQVKRVFTDLGYPEHGADLAAYLCTYRAKLSQGSPASPVISNLAFREVDSQLEALAAVAGIKYTRYADDLVFSGRGELAEDRKTEIKRIVTTSGWVLADRKEYYAKAPMRLQVHGLLVQHDKPRLTKGYRKRLRAFRHLKEAGRLRPGELSKIQGHLAYERAVENFAQEDEET